MDNYPITSVHRSGKAGQKIIWGEHWTHKDIDAACERGRQLERDLVVTNLSEYEVGKEFESHREGGQTLFFQLSAGTRRAICSTVNVFRKKCNVAAPQEVDFVVSEHPTENNQGLIFPKSKRAKERWAGYHYYNGGVDFGLHTLNRIVQECDREGWRILLDKKGGGK